MNQIPNQIKYGQMKAVNVAADQWNHICSIIV